MTDLPQNMSDLPQNVRMELLVGHLADLLIPVRDLVEKLRARQDTANTRADLDYLRQLIGSVYMKQDQIIEHIKLISSENGAVMEERLDT